jgi:hypothetical protein
MTKEQVVTENVDLSPDQLAQFWGYEPWDDDYRDALDAAQDMLDSDRAELPVIDQERLAAAQRWAATQKWTSD